MNVRLAVWSRRLWFVGLAVAVLLACTYTASRSRTTKTEYLPVAMSGVQHLGSKYSISEFYVNGYYGSNVGREGGGGDVLCCVEIPREWREGLTAEVRWKAVRWVSSSIPREEAVERVGIYRAVVAVERYQKPGRLWVHFFNNGRVRIVVSNEGPSGAQHPITRDDPQAAASSTPGNAVNALFSQGELAEIEKRRNNERKSGRE